MHQTRAIPFQYKEYEGNERIFSLLHSYLLVWQYISIYMDISTAVLRREERRDAHLRCRIWIEANMAQDLLG